MEVGGVLPLSETSAFVLQVTSVNEPPVWESTFDQVVLPDKPLHLRIAAQDADQEPLSFSVIGLPTGAQLVPSTVYGEAFLDWIPSLAQVGDHTLTFLVQDSGNGQGTPLTREQTVRLRVRSTNVRPDLFPIGEQTIAEGQTFLLQLNATDADGDRISYGAARVVGGQLTSLPQGVEWDRSLGRLTWTPSLVQAGDYLFRLTATDGVGSRSEDVLIRVTETNQSPKLSPLPKLYGREGDSLTFTVQASDADVQPLNVSLDQVVFNGTIQPRPDGLKYDPSSKTVEWLLGYTSAGSYKLQFSVTDPAGARDELAVEIQVLPTNRAPDLTVPSLRVVQIGDTIQFPIEFLDLDGDSVTLTALQMPQGATLSPEGVFRWTPIGTQAGYHTVTVTADDGKLQTQRTLSLLASFDPSSPELRIVITPSFPAVPGQTILIEPIADSDVDIISVVVKIDGQLQPLDAQRRVTFRSTDPGRHRVEATVQDSEGRQSHREQWIYVRDPSDTSTPFVDIHEISPPILTEPRLLSINIADQTLAEYHIDLVPLDGGTAVRLESGDASVFRQMALDPRRYANGFYLVRVTARDLGGLETIATRELEINSVVKLDSVQRAETDLNVVLDGMSIPFVRYYDSLRSPSFVDGNTVDISEVSFGNAWTLPLVNPQVAIQKSSQNNVGEVAALREGDRLYLDLPDGRRVGYTFSPQQVEPSDLGLYEPRWIADAGVDWQLTTYRRSLQRVGSDHRYYVVGTGLPYSLALASENTSETSALELRAASGIRYGYRLDGETTTGPRFVLERITGVGKDRSVRWTDSGLVAPDGTRVQMVRDNRGRIEELIGPSGEHRVYRYGDRDELLEVIANESGEKSFYQYDDGMRLVLFSHSSQNGTSYRYDDNGNLSASHNVQSHRGGSRQLWESPILGTLTAEESLEYAFTLTKGELQSSATGVVTVGIELQTTEFTPNIPIVYGLVPYKTMRLSDRSIALYVLDSPQTYRLIVSGEGSESGDFALRTYLVGDLNADAAINSLDQELFTLAEGSRQGDANFRTEADANRDGQIDAQDRQSLLASYGYIANRAPSYQPVPFELLANVGEVVNLAQEISDPEEDPTWLRATSSNAVVKPLGGGFVYLIANSSPAMLDLRVDDGVMRSNAISQSIEVQTQSIVGLKILNRDSFLSISDTQRILVVGEKSDGTTVSLPLNALSYTSLEPEVAGITDRGLLVGHRSGTATILVSGFGLTAATAVRVGINDDRVLDFFPDSYALTPGQTRQLLVRQVVGDSIVHLNAANLGTRYFVSHAGLVQISEDGLVTALAEGQVEVTVVQGGTSQVIPITIAIPKIGQQVVNSHGGVISSGNGIIVGIPPEAFDKEVALTVSSVSQSAMPYSLPTTWDFAGGLQVSYSENLAEFPLTITMPAPANRSAGDRVYLFQPVDVTMADGSTLSSWEIVDAMVVGNDGMMRTTSPPNLGVGARNRSSFNGVVNPSLAGMMFAASPSITSFLSAQSDMRLRERSNPPVVSIGYANGGSGQDMYFASAGILGDFLVPLTPDFQIRLSTYSATPTGLVTMTETSLAVDPNTTVTEFAVPLLPRVTLSIPAPTIQQGHLIIDANSGFDGPYLSLTGTFLLTTDQTVPRDSVVGTRLEDLFVTFEIGGRDSVDALGQPIIVGGRDFQVLSTDLRFDDEDKLLVPIPRSVLVSAAEISVTRKQRAPLDGVYQTIEASSNSVKLFVQPRYGFVLNGADGTVTVLDTVATETTSFGIKRDPRELARIPLGVDSYFGRSFETQEEQALS